VILLPVLFTLLPRSVPVLPLAVLEFPFSRTHSAAALAKGGIHSENYNEQRHQHHIGSHSGLLQAGFLARYTKFAY